MKRKMRNIGFWAITFLLSASSCQTDDNDLTCNDTADCVLADQPLMGALVLTFEFIETGEDVFLNGTFNLNDFQIRDANTEQEIEFDFGNFVDLDEDGVVDDGEFVGNTDQLRIILPFNPEIINFMYEIVLSENQIIMLDFSIMLIENSELNPLEITTISFGETIFETLSEGFYNILIEE